MKKMYYAKCAPTHRTNKTAYNKPYYRKSNPSANIRKKDEAYLIELAIPGFTKDQISISVDQNILSIKSTKEATERNGYKLQEFNYDAFTRRFRLAKDANTEAISAKMDNGILLVTVSIHRKNASKKYNH